MVLESAILLVGLWRCSPLGYELSLMCSKSQSMPDLEPAILLAGMCHRQSCLLVLWGVIFKCPAGRHAQPEKTQTEKVRIHLKKEYFVVICV